MTQLRQKVLEELRGFAGRSAQRDNDLITPIVPQTLTFGSSGISPNIFTSRLTNSDQSRFGSTRRTYFKPRS